MVSSISKLRLTTTPREADEVMVCGTRNNGGVVARRDTMAVAHWVQRSRIFEESTTTRTYFRSKEDYLAIKRALTGGNQ
ncbi:hypothetical protein AAVH_00657 [Aphelenchoides avenae]|nr:hypothetical protein AAVH_00657 [Aphelenchus avenae]